jgi:hypothetical protein
MPITQNLTIMRRKALNLVGALSFLALMLPTTSSTAAAQTELPEAHAGLASPIEGSWIFTVDLNNQGTTFTAVASFTACASRKLDLIENPRVLVRFGSTRLDEQRSALHHQNFVVHGVLSCCSPA